jgi:hypothetical protein
MTNLIPTFRVYKNKVLVGTVSATTEQQAHARAFGKYGRCEVMKADMERRLSTSGRVERADSSFTHGRSPYPVGDFEARRSAEIARWKAGE